MQLGAILPQTEIGPDPQDLVRFVRAAEDGGFTYVVVYDHVLGADRATRPDWQGPYDLHSQFHEPFVLYGYLAALTRLELVPGVLILPQRQTALVAKQAAQVDVLAGGRFRLGVGIGWNPVEYEALAIPIWMGGGTNPRTLERIGRLADGWICNTPPGHRLEEALIVVREAAAAAGRLPDTIGFQGIAQPGAASDGKDVLRRQVDRWT